MVGRRAAAAAVEPASERRLAFGAALLAATGGPAFAQSGVAVGVAGLGLGGQRRSAGAGAASARRGAAQARRGLVRCRGLNTGIVGLPNVGKSTMFNALCDKGSAQAANFPFCTIDPNTGLAQVPDERLERLAVMAGSQKVIREWVEYVDIAGLVKGASKGEGLGNKFLGNIRSVDAIVHVVRCFEDDDIIHVDGTVDPERDIETINLELIFSDIDQIERRLEKNKRDLTGKVKGAAEEKVVLDKLHAILMENKPARSAGLSDVEKDIIKSLGLITLKPVIYAANVSEGEITTGNAFVEKVKEIAAATGDKCVMVSAQVEAEINSLEKEDAAAYLEDLGITESGCKTLVKETYNLLGLRTYFTVGPQEARAWTIRGGWLAPKAASVIHSDFEKGFIKAEAVGYAELLECGSEEKAKEKGLLRIEGKGYEVQEGDVMHFRTMT